MSPRVKQFKRSLTYASSVMKASLVSGSRGGDQLSCPDSDSTDSDSASCLCLQFDPPLLLLLSISRDAPLPPSFSLTTGDSSMGDIRERGDTGRRPDGRSRV